MRENLERNIDDEEVVIYGTFRRFGGITKRVVGKNYASIQYLYNTTVLIHDVRDENGTLICDHIWLNLSNSFLAKEIKMLKKSYKDGMKLKVNCNIGYYIKRNHNPLNISKYGIKITTDIGIKSINSIEIIE